MAQRPRKHRHWVGKASSHSNGKWPKRALGAAQKRDRSSLLTKANCVYAKSASARIREAAIVNALANACAAMSTQFAL